MEKFFKMFMLFGQFLTVSLIMLPIASTAKGAIINDKDPAFNEVRESDFINIHPLTFVPKECYDKNVKKYRVMGLTPMSGYAAYVSVMYLNKEPNYYGVKGPILDTCWREKASYKLIPPESGKVTGKIVFTVDPRIKLKMWVNSSDGPNIDAALIKNWEKMMGWNNSDSERFPVNTIYKPVGGNFREGLEINNTTTYISQDFVVAYSECGGGGSRYNRAPFVQIKSLFAAGGYDGKSMLEPQSDEPVHNRIMRNINKLLEFRPLSFRSMELRLLTFMEDPRRVENGKCLGRSL